MLIRGWFGALLLLAFPISTAFAQQTSLEDAEHALNDALGRHDKAAFEQLLTPDAVFFLPKKAHGPEAISNEWLPFLLATGPTMMLTTGDSSQNGDLAFTSGTFAISGQTNNGFATIPAGQYSIVWRLTHGSWKIVSLNGASNGKVRLVPRAGVGAFRFGMTRDEVIAVPDCKPYSNVAQTSGIECPNYTFEGRKMNISFIFGSDRLRRIHLWFYEGESESEAREAATAVIDFLKRTAGGIVLPGHPGEEVTPTVVMQLLNSIDPAKMSSFQLNTPSITQPVVWFARMARYPPRGYFVFLFAEPRNDAAVAGR